MYALRAILAIGMTLALLLPSAAQSTGTATIPLLSYAELGKKVRSLKGKVVLVYFWADY